MILGMHKFGKSYPIPASKNLQKVFLTRTFTHSRGTAVKLSKPRIFETVYSKETLILDFGNASS